MAQEDVQSPGHEVACDDEVRPVRVLGAPARQQVLGRLEAVEDHHRLPGHVQVHDLAVLLAQVVVMDPWRIFGGLENISDEWCARGSGWQRQAAAR